MANSIGGVWKKHSDKGDYLSIKVEIDGEDCYFVAFRNTFKKSGDQSPDYYIPKPKQQEQQPRIPTEKDGIEDDSIPF